MFISNISHLYTLLWSWCYHFSSFIVFLLGAKFNLNNLILSNFYFPLNRYWAVSSTAHDLCCGVENREGKIIFTRRPASGRSNSCHWRLLFQTCLFRSTLTTIIKNVVIVLIFFYLWVFIGSIRFVLKT